MKNEPLVSIVIPVYNGSNYVREAIQSCINQTYKNIEIIVVNDGSNDAGKTASVVNEFKGKVQYFEKPNGGVSSALNLAISHARGEWISWLSHDDLYDRDKIFKQLQKLETVQDANAIIYTDFLVINDKGTIVDHQPCPRIPPSKFRVALLMGSFLHGCSLLIPRRVFTEFGYFDENLRSTQDYKYWFEISRKYNFYLLDQYLVHSRWHGEQGVNKAKSIHIKECNNLYLWAPSVFTWSELESYGFKSWSDFYFNYSKRCKSDGFVKAGRYYFLKGLASLGVGGILSELNNSFRNLSSLFLILFFVFFLGIVGNLNFVDFHKSIYEYNMIPNQVKKTLYEMTSEKNTDWGSSDLRSYLKLKQEISGAEIIVSVPDVMMPLMLRYVAGLKERIAELSQNLETLDYGDCMELAFLAVKGQVKFCKNLSANTYLFRKIDTGFEIMPVRIKSAN